LFIFRDGKHKIHVGVRLDQLEFIIFKSNQVRTVITALSLCVQYFKLKAEPNETESGRRPKFFKSPRREFSELLKEANEKMASKLTNHSSSSSGLPLSVEIEELDSSSDSASPPRQDKTTFKPLSRIPRRQLTLLYCTQRGSYCRHRWSLNPLPPFFWLPFSLHL
jgi:hypothetical protein